MSNDYTPTAIDYAFYLQQGRVERSHQAYRLTCLVSKHFQALFHHVTRGTDVRATHKSRTTCSKQNTNTKEPVRYVIGAPRKAA